jgi:hypothetical protein
VETFQTCIQEVPGTKPGTATRYAEAFCHFPHSLCVVKSLRLTTGYSHLLSNPSLLTIDDHFPYQITLLSQCS